MTATLRERWYVVVAAALLVIAGVVFLVVRNDDSTPDPSKALPVTPQLDTGGIALASLLTKARDETYHATYTSTADAKVSGGTIAMEVWNTKDKSRVNTTQTADNGQVVQTASILRGGKAVVCQKPPKAEWSCHSAPAPASGDAAGLVASLKSQLEGRSVSERVDKVGDRDARCFQISATAGAEQVDACVDQRGILLKLTSSEATIQIAKLDTATPDSAFEPPATVKS